MKHLAILALAGCISGGLSAGQVALDIQLNGLNIETRTIGAEQPNPGGVNGNLRVLQVINHDTVDVTCELAPGPNETLVPASGPTNIPSGRRIGLRLAGSHSDMPIHAQLNCTSET